MQTYKDLEIYHISYQLAIEIHTISQDFPAYAQNDIGNQMRSAARAIPANLAKGYGRSISKEDLCQLVKETNGSIEELLFHLEFCRQTGIITLKTYHRLFTQYSLLAKQIRRLIRFLEGKSPTRPKRNRASPVQSPKFTWQTPLPVSHE